MGMLKKDNNYLMDVPGESDLMSSSKKEAQKKDSESEKKEEEKKEDSNEEKPTSEPVKKTFIPSFIGKLTNKVVSDALINTIKNNNKKKNDKSESHVLNSQMLEDDSEPKTEDSEETSKPSVETSDSAETYEDSDEDANPYETWRKAKEERKVESEKKKAEKKAKNEAKKAEKKYVGREVKNNAKSICSAVPGDYYISNNGEKKILSQYDIDFAKSTVKDMKWTPDPHPYVGDDNTVIEAPKETADSPKAEIPSKDEKAENVASFSIKKDDAKSETSSDETTEKQTETKENAPETTEKPSETKVSEGLKDDGEIGKKKYLQEMEKKRNAERNKFTKEDDKEWNELSKKLDSEQKDKINKEKKSEKEQKKAEKEAHDKKAYEEWQNNPNKNFLNYIASDNGIPTSSKVLAGLGALMAIGGAAAEGAGSGIRGTPTYTPVNTDLQQMLGQQNEEARQRISNKLNEQNKEQVSLARRKSIVDSNNDLNGLDEEKRNMIYNDMTNGTVKSLNDAYTDYFSDNKKLNELLASGDTSGYNHELKRLYASYVNSVSSYKEGGENRAVQLTNETLNQNIVNGYNDAINAVDSAIAKINNTVKELNETKIEKLIENKKGVAEILKSNIDAYRNLYTTQGLVKGNFNFSMGKGKGTLPLGMNGGIDIGGSSSNSQDKGVNQRLSEIENSVKVFEEGLGKNIADYEASVKSAIEGLISLRESYKESKELLEANRPSSVKTADDGVFSPDGSEQKLVKNNGEEILLNPKDTVIAIKNPEDVKKALGYVGNPINKDCDYYINLLRSF